MDEDQVKEDDMEWLKSYQSLKKALDAAEEKADARVPGDFLHIFLSINNEVLMIMGQMIPGFNSGIFHEDPTINKAVQCEIIKSWYEINLKREPHPHTCVSKTMYVKDRRLLLIEYFAKDEQGKRLMDFIRV